MKALRLAFAGASNAGLLPAFGWTLLVVAALSLGAGGWAGMRWERGAAAMDKVDELRAQREADAQAYRELLTTAKGLQAHDVATSIASRNAADRMGALAASLEKTLETNRDFTARQHDALADLLDRRPDLRTLRLGSDVLQHWNRSNAGAAGNPAAPAAAGPAGQSANPVPAAPAREERPGAGSVGQPRSGGGAVSRLQRPHGQPAARARRMAAHRVGLVLQRHRGHGDRRRRVPSA